ncbi:MAG TPA: hypothetical protein VHB20_19080, partial [Verrucomicrobiae bacterium]|nr:hypothetical protein [Verrucomicrobiae bacterium]
MKHFVKTTLLWLAVCNLASAGALGTFENRGLLLTPTNINAVHFNNYGTVSFSLLNQFTNLNGSAISPVGGQVFQTRDTLYYTNGPSALMVGQPGFAFDDVIGAKIRPSTAFVNKGKIVAQDFPTVVGNGILSVVNGTGFVPFPPGARSIPSQIKINANTVSSPGTLAVGNVGLLDVTGQNVDLSFGILAAGSVSDVDSNALYLNTVS